MYSYGDMEPEIYPGHIFDLLGSCDVIGRVTVGLGMCGFLYVINNNNRTSILHNYGDNEPHKDTGVATLIIWA